MYKNIDKNLIPASLSDIIILMIENKESESDYNEINNIINITLNNYKEYTYDQICLLFFDFICYSFFISSKNDKELLVNKIYKMIEKNIFPRELFDYSIIKKIFYGEFITDNEKILLFEKIIKDNPDNFDCIRFLYLNKLIKLLIYSGKFISTYKDLYIYCRNLQKKFSENIKEISNNFTSGFFYLM